MALERHSPLESKATSQQRIRVCPVNQFLNSVFDDVTLEVPEPKLTANGLEQRPHVFHLMLRWKRGHWVRVANRKIMPDLFLPGCKVVPGDNSSRENSAGRIGCFALCGQRSVSYDLNSQIERMAGFEILLESLWL